MILSDTDLIARLRDGSLVIEPLEDLDVQVQPASVDLRLGSEFRGPGASEVEVASIARPRVLARGEMLLGTTLERVVIPHDLVARVEGRSSVGRLGLLVHATAGFVDPGFEGQITLELVNLGPQPITLEPGVRICQLTLHLLTSPASRPYGVARGSKYAGQRGPTSSRWEGGRGSNDEARRDTQRPPKPRS
jgi:dCTP deaminase